jgi:hypothetical protein
MILLSGDDANATSSKIAGGGKLSGNFYGPLNDVRWSRRFEQ